MNIARNGAIDHIRRRSSQYQKQAFDIDIITDEIENRFTHSLNTDTIGMQKIIASLSPKQRLSIDMVYFNGYRHSEIAEELNMPIGGVKTSLRYAILSLRRIFCNDKKFAA